MSESPEWCSWAMRRMNELEEENKRLRADLQQLVSCIASGKITTNDAGTFYQAEFGSKFIDRLNRSLLQQLIKEYEEK